MNCRKSFKNFQPSPQVTEEVQRIKSIWNKCRTQYGNDGKWLFGEYSIVDAMFAPIVLRFDIYGIKLDGIEQEYSQTVLSQKHIIDWVKSSKQETEVIASDEI